MTQLIQNYTNNIEFLGTKSKFDAVSLKSSLDKISNGSKGFDKSVKNQGTDFDKVFEKQVSTQEKRPISAEGKNNVANAGSTKQVSINSKDNIKEPTTKTSDVDKQGEISTLGSLKEVDADNTNNVDLGSFRELLAEVTDEANVEKSLDLTLAKDISEIISQLKEMKNQVVEDTKTSTEDGDKVVQEELLSSTEEVSDIENLDSQDEESNALVEQLLAYLDQFNTNKVQVQDKTQEESSENLVDSSTEVLEFTNDLIQDFSQSNLENEIVDITSKLPSVNIKTSKPEIDVNVDSHSDLMMDEDMIKELNIESVNAETDTSSDSSLMDYQSPQEQGLKAVLTPDFESFELRFDKTMNSQSVQPKMMNSAEITPSKIIEQITKQLEGLQNTSKVNIVLNPESLGKVTVQLVKSGEGLSAQFTVASQEVKDLLMKGLEGLKETLTAQGVGVDNVSIKFNEAQKSEYNPDWTEQENSHGGNKEQGRSTKQEKEKGLFEQMMAQLDDENGNV